MQENPEILERCACLGDSALWLIVGVVDIEILERCACLDFGVLWGIADQKSYSAWNPGSKRSPGWADIGWAASLLPNSILESQEVQVSSIHGYHVTLYYHFK